ncbi:MAG TPA: ABC transporter permease, partial [Vicinamibacterales bacterium]
MMRSLRAWLVRLWHSVTGSRRDGDFEAELASHLQLHVDDNMRAGMTRRQAERAARIALGGLVQTEERYRDRRGLPWVEALGQDAAYSVRMLRKNPGFTLTAIATLALGVGANTAIFSVVNAVLLQPLPFPAADRLVMVFATNTRSGTTTDVASYPDYLDWSNAQSFEHAGAYAGRSVTISGSGGAEFVAGMRVSTTMFETLGTAPALGRAFTIDEQNPGAAAVVILSDGLWKRQFGGDPRALGSVLRINDVPYTIVGVMPPGFSVSADTEQLYVPLTVDPSRSHGFLRVVGRLRPGVTVADARA